MKMSEQEALNLLNDPNLLGRLENILDVDCNVVREKRTKLYIFLIFLSSKPKKRLVDTKGNERIIQRDPQMLQVKGDSRTGKTHMCNAISKFFKVKVMGDWSAKFLNYVDLTGVDILYFQEMLQADQEGSSLRLISNEDGGYTVGVVAPEGRGFAPTEKKIDAITFVTTHTRYKTNDQLDNRSHILNTDATPEQTEAIVRRMEAKGANEIFELTGKIKPTANLKILNQAVDMLDEWSFAILTSQSVVRNIFPHFINARIRSDYGKIVTMIKLVTYLYQHQRPFVEIKMKDGHKRKVFFSMPQDVYWALEIIQDSLLTMTIGLEARQRALLPYLDELRQKRTIVKGAEVEGFILQDASKYLGKSSYSTVMRQCMSLIDVGLLEIVQEGHGTTKIFKVTSEPEDIEALLNVSKNFEINRSLLDNIVGESKHYFKNISKEITMKMPNDAAFDITLTPEWFDKNHKTEYKAISTSHKSEFLGQAREYHRLDS